MKMYEIIGKVAHQNTGRGIEGLKVEAWDKDLLFDDLVGSALTGADGSFTIQFTQKHFQELFLDQKPDLFFRVYQGETLLKDTAEYILWNINQPDIKVDICLDLPSEPIPEPQSPETLQEYHFFGRLINKETSKALTGFQIKATDLDAQPESQRIGYTFSNERGLFSFDYILAEKEPIPQYRRFKLQVYSAQRKVIHEEEIQVRLDDSDVRDIIITMPVAPVEPSPTFGELDKQLNLGIPEKLKSFLETKNIHTLADLRKAGGLKHMTNLPMDPEEPVIAKLEAHADLGAISKDVDANNQLIEKGFASVSSIAKSTRSRFISSAHSVMGDYRAFRAHVKARAQIRMSSQMMTGIAANEANGFSNKLEQLGIELPKWIKRKCGCEDCESAVSPLAYLADLLEYSINRLTYDGTEIDIHFLNNTLHQPFGKLPAVCDQMETQIPQARICIEVLRSYLKQNPSDEKEKHYRSYTYLTLLQQLGVSYDEIRIARASVPSERMRLADRLGVLHSRLEDLITDTEPVNFKVPVDVSLGISAEDVKQALLTESSELEKLAEQLGILPVQLNELYMDVSAVSEQRMEELFGFKNTRSEPLSTITEPYFQKWRLEYLNKQWEHEDWIAVDTDKIILPIIDPDVIDLVNIVNPVTGNHVFKLWDDRRKWIDKLLKDLRASDKTLAVFNYIVTDILGISLPDLDRLFEDFEQGIDIEQQLEQLVIDRAAISYLLRIRTLLQINEPVIPDEWEDIYSILIQVQKRHRYADWRNEEQAEGISLSPEYFKLKKPDPLQFPPPKPQSLNEWRVSIIDKRNWQDILSARIDQQNNVIDSLKTAVLETEKIVLPMLRDTLILATQSSGVSVIEQADYLSKLLFIDFKSEGCHLTTRISQAITTIQGLLFAVRTRQLKNINNALELDEDAFDEEWQWIGSYSSWRSAMFAYIYPENILLPSLRQRQTPAFRRLVEETRRNKPLNPEHLCRAVKSYTDYVNDIGTLQIEATCLSRTHLSEGKCTGQVERGWRCLFYMFAIGRHTKTAYWSVYDPEAGGNYSQSFWEVIPGFENIVNVIGAVSYDVTSDHRYAFVFARQIIDEKQKLIFNKYDLEERRWDSVPTQLKLPTTAHEFTAVVMQANQEKQPPRLAIRTPDGAIYQRRLNKDGSDWEDIKIYDENPDSGQWIPTIIYRFKLSRRDENDKLIFSAIEQLCGMVQITHDQFVLIFRSQDGYLFYRLFGSNDDAVCRVIDKGDYKGAFSWPGQGAVYVFYGTGNNSKYKKVTPLSSSEEIVFTTENNGNPISKIEEFNIWLKRRTGVSLQDNGFTVIASPMAHATTLLDLLTFAKDNNVTRQEYWYVHLFGGNDFNALGFYITHVYKTLGFIEGLINSHKDYTELRIANSIVKGLVSSDLHPGFGLTLCEVLRILIGNALYNIYYKSNEVGYWYAYRDGYVGNIKILQRTGNKEVSDDAIESMNGLMFIASSSDSTGPGKYASSTRRWISYQQSNASESVNRALFKVIDQKLVAISPVPVAPRLSGAMKIYAPIPEAELLLQKNYCKDLLDRYMHWPSSLNDYIKEFFYFAPIHIALQLQHRGYYDEALDWFRTVYDYSLPVDERKIYYGLVREEFLDNTYERAENWLLDPLNPHSIAETRINTYTRFTVLSIARCFLEYADAEYTRDTPESIPRARRLYMTAQELLESEDLKIDFNKCTDLVGSIEIELEDEQWQRVWEDVEADLGTISDAGQLRTVTGNIQSIWAGKLPISQKIKAIRDLIATIKERAAQPKDIENILEQKTAYQQQLYRIAQSSPVLEEAINRSGEFSAEQSDTAVSMITGLPVSTLNNKETELTWLRQPRASEQNTTLPQVMMLRSDYREVVSRHSLMNDTYTAQAAKFATANPVTALQAVSGRTWQYTPSISFSFCIPINPVIEGLQRRAELNLYKIRSCRNIMGIERAIEPYAAPTDKVSGMTFIDSRGQLVVPGTLHYISTPYRYITLIERAKQLVSLAQQMEAAFLSALEKRDAESYQLLKARQDLQLSKAGLRTQDLRVKGAEKEISLATLQKERSLYQASYYQKLLSEGQSALEISNIAFLSTAAAGYSSTGIASIISLDFGGIASAAAQSASTMAQIMATQASHERRTQEWNLQKNLARFDTMLGDQQIQLAQNRLLIAAQERLISSMQSEFAKQTLDFLSTKFTNADLYDWMSNVLEGVYSYFLQQATSIAKTAASQLAFERQVSVPAYIQDDYWMVEDNTSSDDPLREQSPDRLGMTGSARLLQDIYQLDQYAFETDKRKNQLTKHISLAAIGPVEFQMFRQTGVLNFATPMELFDQDFPGDYLRLIKRVRVSVYALVPPLEGIKATLSVVGQSRVTIAGDVFQTINVSSDPETIALSSPREATGLFELQPQLSDKLNPFESKGVDTQWQFKMPKAANRFNYDTIMDVIVTLEYTSLSDFLYQKQVIHNMNNKFSAQKAFSMRYSFPDEWYHLNNADQVPNPMVVSFNTRQHDFPANLDNMKIKHIELYFALKDDEKIEIPVTHLLLSSLDSTGLVGGRAETYDNGLISTRRSNAASWNVIIGKSPIGSWELSLNGTLSDGQYDGLPVKTLFDQDKVDDILLNITYSGTIPPWPE